MGGRYYAPSQTNEEPSQRDEFFQFGFEATQNPKVRRTLTMRSTLGLAKKKRDTAFRIRPSAASLFPKRWPRLPALAAP